MGAYDIPQVIKAKTASTYTVTDGDYGALITNRGGGALTVTLPPPASTTPGAWVEFYQVAAGDFVLTTAAGDEIAAANNASADSVTLGTDNEEIGNYCRLINDGTAWLLCVSIGKEAFTHTITDA